MEAGHVGAVEVTVTARDRYGGMTNDEVFGSRARAGCRAIRASSAVV